MPRKRVASLKRKKMFLSRKLEMAELCP